MSLCKALYIRSCIIAKIKTPFLSFNTINFLLPIFWVRSAVYFLVIKAGLVHSCSLLIEWESSWMVCSWYNIGVCRNYMTIARTSMSRIILFLYHIYSHVYMIISVSAVGNTQKCRWSCSWGHNRTHNLYITGRGGREHAGVKDFATYGCYNRRLALPLLFLVFILLPSPVSLKS